MVPAGGETRGVGVTIAFVRSEEDGGGNVGDGAEAELIVKKSVADKVGAVRRGFRTMG